MKEDRKKKKDKVEYSPRLALIWKERKGGRFNCRKLTMRMKNMKGDSHRPTNRRKEQND